MNLEQGVRYNIASIQGASPKRTNYNTLDSANNKQPRGLGLLKGISYGFSVSSLNLKQIDYVLEAKDSNSDFVPNVSFNSGLNSGSSAPVLVFNSETLLEFTGPQSTLAGMANAGHSGISFFGADQTTFSNIKYNETLSGIENDTMYVLSSNCTVTYNGTEYKYGDFFSVASDENEPEITLTKTGAPLFVEVLKGGNSTVSSQKYYVYGSQEAIFDEESVEVGSSTFYPGDVFTGVAGSITVTNSASICLIKISEENLKQWFSYAYSKETITAHGTEEKTYLIYDNVSCLYNSSLVKPNPLLNNVFKTTLDSIYDQPGKMVWLNTTDRKKPIIREIIKSSAVKPGEEYYLFHDEFTGFGRSNTITYNDIQYSTVISPGLNVAGKQPVFRGVNLKTTYSTGYKNLDKQDAHTDPDFEGAEPQARNLDLASGNPMVLKKEPVGLKAGQKYVFVAESITDIKEGKYYMLSKGSYITYNDLTISIGQVFKGANGKTSWETIPEQPPNAVYSNGEEEITLVTNKVTVNTLENNGAPITLETTIKNRKVEFTASDNTTSPYSVSGSSPILYWTKPSDAGKGYIYKSVESLEENKRYYVAAEGDGFVLYPPEDLMYSCVRPDRGTSDSSIDRLTKAEIKEQKEDGEIASNYSLCVNNGGEWVPEAADLEKYTERYHNRGSFYAIKGKCSYGSGDRSGERLWEKNTKDSCSDAAQAEIDKIYDEATAVQKTAIDQEPIFTEWAPYSTFNEKKDTLLTYAITESNHDQSLVHEVVFEHSNAEHVKPDDTKLPQENPITYAVAPLKQELFQYQVLRFPRQGDLAEPTFIVAEKTEINKEQVRGWLLYAKIPAYVDNPNNDASITASNAASLAERTATASLAVDKTTNGADSVNPFNLYYAEPLELKIETEALEGHSTITLYSLPCSLAAGELLNFKDDSGKISQFKVTAAAEASTSQTVVTGLIMCPESSGNKIAVDSIAKVNGKKVGTYCLNKKFKNNQRFVGVSSRPIVRLKDRRTVTTTDETNAGALPVSLGNWSNDDESENWNVEQRASENASIHKVVVKEAAISTPAEQTSYSIGGRGFIKVGSTSYHGTVSGRITIKHPKAGTSLEEYNKSKFPWYTDEYVSVQTGRSQVVGISEASTHVPSATKLYFPNGVFELLKDLELGSTTMTGRFVNQVPDRSINLSPKRLYHGDESNFVYIEGQTIDFSAGTKEVSTDSNTFLYRATKENKYRDAYGTGNSRGPEASSERFSIAIAGQEYYIKVIPEEITSKEVDNNKFPIEENLEYTVKATGETIELASSYDPANTEASTGISPADREQTLGIVSELKEALPINTVLTFYPADQVRSLQGNPGFEVDKYVSVHRKYEGRTPYDPELTQKDRMMSDPIPAKTGGVRFTLTIVGKKGDTSITGKTEEKGWDKSWGTNVLKGAKLTAGAIAETSRAVVYNDKVFRTGETFVGTRNTDGIDNREKYTQYSNSFLNSTKNEKVYAYNAYVDYLYEEDIFSGGEFNIDLDLVTQKTEVDLSDRDKFTRGRVTGSESKFEFEGASWTDDPKKTDENITIVAGSRRHFYYLPPSPTLSLSASSAKIYKVNYKYINSIQNKYTFTSGVTYKFGGTGDGYVDTALNTVGKVSSILSGEKTFYPSSPSVYDKTPTSLEPSKFYILEYPETFDTGTIQRLSTLKYNSKKYFSHNYDFKDMEESIKIKYFSSEYVIRYPMLNSYVFGRPNEQFVHNVRNFNGNLGKPNFQKIHETYKRISGGEDYGGVELWEGLDNFNRYFDILDNSFESFSILRKEKYYNKWNKFKLAEQDIEGVRTFVNRIGGDRIDYEYPLSLGIVGAVGHQQLIMDFSSGETAAEVKNLPVIRLVDAEILSSTVSDLTYRVESSQESYFSAPDSSGLEVIRTLQPRSENRLKANNRYYLTGGSIKYLGYNGDSGALKSVDGDTSETITSGQVFTGKADYFDKSNNRVYFGNSNKHVIKEIQSNGEYTGATEVVTGTNHEDKIIENRLGTFEFWNHNGDAPLVYPIIEQWEVETNKIYEIAGSATVDRVEYEGKVYKPGETFKGKQLDFNQPLSGDQDMFIDMLSTDDYKGAAARGLRPWMDDSYYVPRERGYISLTPLIYRTITGSNIKANVKYIAKGSGTITYDGETYNAQDKIAYPDNHFDGTGVTSFTVANLAKVRRKVRQNEKIETGVNYYVYGAGKVKYISQVKADGDSADGYSSIDISAGGAGVVLPIYSVLEFSNGSTFILTQEASASATTLIGTLSGNLSSGDVAPVTINKSNMQVEVLNDYAHQAVVNNASGYNAGTYDNDIQFTVDALTGTISSGSKVHFTGGGILTLSQVASTGDTYIFGSLTGASVTNNEVGTPEVTVDTIALPFNIPRGEVLYFTNGTIAKGKLTVSENALAGAVTINGLLENVDLTLGDKANIVYAREHVYKEYEADGKFLTSFTGLRGYDYFEIAEGNPEIYTDVASGKIKKGERYYVFKNTVTYNSNTYQPSNVFYGKTGTTGFTSSNASVVEVIELENLEAGNYTVYGNSDNSNKLFTHAYFNNDAYGTCSDSSYLTKESCEGAEETPEPVWTPLDEAVDLQHGSLFTWAADDTIEKYNSKTGVQSPAGPIIYSKTLKIISAGQTYKLESLGDSAPRGVVKYVEKSGTCYRPAGVCSDISHTTREACKAADETWTSTLEEVSGLTTLQDCLIEDVLRVNLSKKEFGVGNTGKYGSYKVTVVADSGVQGYSAGPHPLGLECEVRVNDFTKYKSKDTPISFEYTDDNNAEQQVSNHKVREYKVISADIPIMFFNGGVLIPSEDVWVEGKYIKSSEDDVFDPSRTRLYEYDEATCSANDGVFVQDGEDLNTKCKIGDSYYTDSHDGGGNLTDGWLYSRLNRNDKEKLDSTGGSTISWIAVTVKGEVMQPASIKHEDEASLFSWKEDEKTAYFTTDGSSYTSGSITTIKKSKNGEIKNGTEYTLAGGVEISYNGVTTKRGGSTFFGVNDSLFANFTTKTSCEESGGVWGSESCTKGLSDWKFTKNSDGTEYLTSVGSETEFTGLPDYDEVEIVSGNPQIFAKGESFLAPEGDLDETYVLEGEGEIKVLGNEKISNISGIKYSGAPNNEADLFVKTGAVETIKPRGVIPPTNLQTGYKAGVFTGDSETTYKLRTLGWDSVAWAFHKLGAIRSAKMRTDTQWGTTIDLINDESFTFNDENSETSLEPTSSTFLNSGITEAEDYIDVSISTYFDYEAKCQARDENNYWENGVCFDSNGVPTPLGYKLKKSGNNSVLVFEGFKIPYASKRLGSFPDVTPYSVKNSSTFSDTSDIKQSRLFNLFASRIAVGKDAVIFGKGEVAIYDYDDSIDDSDSPTLKSTTFIKAYSNLKTSWGTGVTPEEGETVLSSEGLKKNYRYIVTLGSSSVKKLAIKIHNTNGFHNKKPDGTTQTSFGTTDSAYDFFKNEASNGIRFKRLGRESVAGLTGATFDSTIGFKESYSAGTYDEDNVNNSFIKVSALPVNLEAGEVLKTSSATLTLSERALKGAVKVKGTVTGTLSGSVRRRVKVDAENIFGSSSEQIAGTFDAYDDTTTSGNIINCPTSLTDGQVSTALTDVVDDLAVSVGSRFTAIMDSPVPSGITVSYSNVVPKAFFELAATYPDTNNDYITNPRVEYSQGDPKFLFIVSAFDQTSDETIPEAATYDGEDLQDVILTGPTNYRYHLYDINYSTSTQAKIEIKDEDGTEKTAKNNFFIHNGTANSFSLLSTKIKNNQDPPVALTSKVYIYKEVLSGEIEKDKKYLVYGTGLVTYGSVEITAVNDFVAVISGKAPEDGVTDLAFNCFVGVEGVEDFLVNPYNETFWNIYDTDDVSGTLLNPAVSRSGVPVRDRTRRASAPRVFELVYFSYYEDGEPSGDSTTLSGTAADNKGTIYYVYGEGGITYGTNSNPLNNKTIYATNKYIAVGGENYDDIGTLDPPPTPVDTQAKCEVKGGVWSNGACSISNANKLEPSNAVYAGRIQKTIGHEYEYNNDGIINPVPKHHFFAESKYTMGNTEQFLSGTDNIDRDTDVVLYRKVHALDGITNGEEYKIFSSIQGEGKSGVNSSGGVEDNVTNSNVVLNSIEYNSVSESPGGEIVGAEQTKNSGEITLKATGNAPDDMATKTLSNKPKLLMSRKRLSQAKRKGVFSGIRLDKCLNCVLDTNAWYIGGSTKVVRSQVDFYDTLYDDVSDAAVTSGEAVLTESGPDKYQVGKPKGFTYTVRGGGSIRYPVKSTGLDVVVGGKTLTRVIPRGESFTPIENESYLGMSYGFYKKETGEEMVYMVVDQEDSADYWKGLDRFAGMAPDRQGTPDGEIKQGISYRVLMYEAPKRLKKLGVGEDRLKGLYYIRGEKEDKKGLPETIATYNGKSCKVGSVFVGVSGKKSLDPYCSNSSYSTPQDCVDAGYDWIGTDLGVFVREESGTYGNAPEEDWSNQWSMFMSQTVTSPSTTSLWHHDVYGDVLGFLNNRCHFYSLDFQSNKYSHLLQTFAYGIKPVLRSEAPSGYTYLEGSNAKQSWFSMPWFGGFIYDASSGKSKHADYDEFDNYLNKLYFRSCQIYKPDYPIDTVSCIDLGQSIGDNIELKPNGPELMQSGICIKNETTLIVKDQNACAEAEGTWYPLKDMVEITLNRRLDHRPDTRKIRKNISKFSLSYIKRLHKDLSPGPFNPESYRTDENAVIEYLIKQRKWKHTQLSTKEEPYFVSNSCHKARIGDSAPDIQSWGHPDDPWGACDSRFYFTKQVPYAYDNDNTATTKDKTPIELKTFQQMEFYLRAMCGGFIDKESNPKPLEYGGIEPGLLPSSVPVCVMSKDYEYLFENLAYQALDETNESLAFENYKTIEMWHDSSKLKIKRVRKARITRTFKSASNGGLRVFTEAEANHFYEIYMGSIKTEPIGTYVPTSASDTFSDDYYENIQDDFAAPSKKKFRIPMTQKYIALQINSSLSVVNSADVLVGLSGTSIVEDVQSEAQIQWDVNPAALYYVLERKRSKMPHYSEWSQVSAIRDFEFSALNQKRWVVNMSPTQFEKIEFRVKVFYKENQFSGRMSKVIEASSDEPGITSPVTVKAYPYGGDFSSEDTRMLDVTGDSFGGESIASATESFADGTRTYKIEVGHFPSLWLGNQRATTLDGKARLFYRVEFRTLTSYPDGEGQEGGWETVARFDNPSTSRINYTDSEDYSFENVSYRVAYVKSRLGGVRWIPALLRNDRMGKPSDPKGYGPLQNVKLRAALFNQFANAINLLNEVRIDLPISVRTKEIVSEYVTPVTNVGDPSSTWDNPDLPTWGIYAKGEYAPGPHQTQISYEYSDDLSLGASSNEGGTFIGTTESDESVESGFFSVCAYKGFGYAMKPWVEGGSSYHALFFQNKKVLIAVPNDQAAMTHAIPRRFLDMFWGKHVVLSGLNEHDTDGSIFSPWDKPYHTTVGDYGGQVAEAMVFCRNIDETGFGMWDAAIYDKLEDEYYIRRPEKQIHHYRSWCGYVPGMAMLEGPALPVSDNALFVPPMGVEAGSHTHLVCSVGGAASTHCFSSRAGTGDNNMTLTVEVLELLGSKPFNSTRTQTGRPFYHYSWNVEL